MKAKLVSMLGLLLITAAGYGADPSVGPNGVPYALPPTNQTTNVGSMYFTNNRLVFDYDMWYPTNVTIEEPTVHGTNRDPRVFYHFTIHWNDGRTDLGLLSTLRWEVVTNWYDTGGFNIRKSRHWVDWTRSSDTLEVLAKSFPTNIVIAMSENLYEAQWDAILTDVSGYECGLVKSNLVVESIWEGKTNRIILDTKYIRLETRSYTTKTIKEYH